MTEKNSKNSIIFHVSSFNSRTTRAACRVSDSHGFSNQKNFLQKNSFKLYSYKCAFGLVLYRCKFSYSVEDCNSVTPDDCFIRVFVT